VCVDLYREQQRDPLVMAGDLHPLAERTIRGKNVQTPEAAMLRGEAMRFAGRAVSSLPERLRTPFVLHVLDGLEYAEVAERMGLSVHNVRKRMQEARQRLRNVLAHARGGYVLQQRVVHVRRQTPATIEQLQRYLAAYPSGWKKRLELARRLCESGRHLEALEHYRLALARNPRLVGAWIELSQTLEHLGRDDEAAGVLTRGIATCGGGPAALFRFLRDVRGGSAERTQALLAAIPEGFLDDHGILVARRLLDAGFARAAERVLARPALASHPQTEALVAEAHKSTMP
jgi:predicted Zn-dependent protease